MDGLTLLALLSASGAAFALALLSAVSAFGGGVLLLPVFTALFGLRVAVPALTLVQLVSNGSRVALDHREVRWRLVGWFALGAVPLAVVGGLLLAQAPLAPLQRLLGAFLLLVVARRRWRAHHGRVSREPGERAFVAVGAASGLGSALLGSVGPLTAPSFLAVGLARGAYTGTEAASAVVLHLAKLGAYGAGDLLSAGVLLLGLVLSPASLAGAWVGRRVVGRLSERTSVAVVEAALVAAGVLFLVGL